MTIQEVYKQLNGDYADAVSRLGMESLVERFAVKFCNDKTMAQLREAVAQGDIEAEFRAAHTLKGVAANVSFSELYHKACELTEQLRPMQEHANPVLLQNLEAEYTRTIAALEEYVANK